MYIGDMNDDLDTHASEMMKDDVLMQPAHLAMLMMMGEKKGQHDDWESMQLLTESFIQAGKNVLAKSEEGIGMFSPDALGLVGLHVNESIRVTWEVLISKQMEDRLSRIIDLIRICILFDLK